MPDTLADFAPDVAGDALIGRASHELQGLPHLLFGKDIQVRRLLQIHRQRFLERAVENRVSRGIHKIGDQNRIALRHDRACPAQEDGHRQPQHGQYDDRHDRQVPDPARLAVARRPQGGGTRGCGNQSRVRVALQTLQVGPHFGCALVAQVAVFLQQFGDDLFQLQRHVGIQPHRQHRRTVQDGFEDDRRGVSAERQRAGRHLVQHRAKGEQVGAGVQVLASRLLGRHVSHGPDG